MAHYRCELHGERPEMVHPDAICNLCVWEAMELDPREGRTDIPQASREAAEYLPGD